jgi:hypothetical protein
MKQHLSDDAAFARRVLIALAIGALALLVWRIANVLLLEPVA